MDKGLSLDRNINSESLWPACFICGGNLLFEDKSPSLVLVRYPCRECVSTRRRWHAYPRQCKPRNCHAVGNLATHRKNGILQPRSCLPGLPGKQTEESKVVRQARARRPPGSSSTMKRTRMRYRTRMTWKKLCNQTPFE